MWLEPTARRPLALRITDSCIECMACMDVCSYQAVCDVRGVEACPGIAIDPSACTHCWPFDPRPRCVDICPVDCIIVDGDWPVPSVQLIRRELEQVLSVAGPFEAARTIARLRQWIREWHAGTASSALAAVDVDKVLDFYNFLSLLEREYSPCDAAGAASTPSRAEPQLNV